MNPPREIPVLVVCGSWFSNTTHSIHRTYPNAPPSRVLHRPLRPTHPYEAPARSLDTERAGSPIFPLPCATSSRGRSARSGAEASSCELEFAFAPSLEAVLGCPPLMVSKLTAAVLGLLLLGLVGCRPKIGDKCSTPTD